MATISISKITEKESLTFLGVEGSVRKLLEIAGNSIRMNNAMKKDHGRKTMDFEG